MSHLTLLSPEHIVYVLGGLGLREHLLCFRPAEPLFKELRIQSVPLGPRGLNQGWCWRGLTSCYFCCGRIGVWLCTSFIRMTRITLAHRFRSSRAVHKSVTLCTREWGHVHTRVLTSKHLWLLEREGGKGSLQVSRFPFPLAEVDTSAVSQRISQSWVNRAWVNRTRQVLPSQWPTCSF